MCPMCDGTMGVWGWVMMLVMALFWIAVLGGLGWLVYRLVNRRRESEIRSTPRDAADILRERYARGDIDRATFERMSEDLDRGDPL